MASATLERDGTSISLPLLDSSSGTPLVAVSWGKPNQEINNTGEPFPIPQDMWSGNTQYTLSGFFTGTDAYQKAIDLTDLVLSNTEDSELLLNIDMPEFDTDITVAPGAGQDGSLTLNYNPGGRTYVGVDLSLTRILQKQSGYDQSITTPTTAGSGPIQISYRGTSVDLTEGVSITRSCGRPNDVVRRVPQEAYPNYRAKHKTVNDSFEIGLQFTTDAISQLNDLVDIFNQRLGRNSLTLDFQGLFGMGSFDVVPVGSNAMRHVRRSGEQGTQNIPQISLRRVRDLG